MCLPDSGPLPSLISMFVLVTGLALAEMIYNTCIWVGPQLQRSAKEQVTDLTIKNVAAVQE